MAKTKRNKKVIKKDTSIEENFANLNGLFFRIEDSSAFSHSGALLINEVTPEPLSICCIIDHRDEADELKMRVSVLCTSYIYEDIDIKYEEEDENGNQKNIIKITLKPFDPGNNSLKHKWEEYEFDAESDNDFEILFRLEDSDDPLSYGKKQKHIIAYSSIKFIGKIAGKR